VLTLNGKFLSLARLLPSLATVRRPSKSAIVNGSISHLTYQRNQRLLAAKLLRNVCAQHDALLSEVNEWRKASGYAPKQMSPTWTDEMEEVVAVEKEQFGNFSTMGGEGDDNDNEDDDTNSNDMSLDQANLAAATFGGLITPRSSAELDAASHSHALFNLAQAQVQATQNQASQNQVPHAQAQAQAQAQIQAALAVHAAQVLQQQQQQQQQQQHNDKRAAAMNAGLWSQDFAFGLANNGNRSSTPGSVLPFNAFVSESFDASSTGSPAGSAGSVVGGVFTPPTSADMGVYTHTPSPRSTQSINDEKPTSQPAQQAWNPAMFLQQMQAHQTQQAATPVFTPSNMYAASMFPGMQQGQHMAQPTAAPQVPSQQTQASLLSAAAASSDAFTQSLLASMFPTQGVSAEQVDQWRKLALSGLAQQPAAPQRAQPIRSDSTMSLNRGLAGMWEQPAVEGF
jgi:hypothetical protein